MPTRLDERLMKFLVAFSMSLFLFSCILPAKPVEIDDFIGPDKSPVAAASQASQAPGARKERAEAAAPEPEKKGPLELGVQGAIVMALENNRSLKVARLNPSIRRTFEEQERAAFDPELTADFVVSQAKRPQQFASPAAPLVESGNAEAGVGVSQFLPSGTDVSVGLTADRNWSDRYDDQYDARIGLSVTQALLQGRGLEVNLVDLRQAELNTRISQYELRGFAEDLVASVEDAYWEYALAQRQISIYEESMQVAEQHLKETEEYIKVGKMAETEIVAAEAEIAQQRQGLILARSRVETTRLRLMRLLNPGGEGMWRREILLTDRPLVPEVQMDGVESHVKVALQMNPALNSARLGVQNGELTLVKTKNGLLPKMDLFISLGKTGYADSFGGTFRNSDGEGYDVLAGLSFSYPFRNRDARAVNERALLSLEQSKDALANLAQLVELDVRIAYIAVVQALDQIGASRATRQLDEEKLRVETEKFRVGRSTNFLVAQAQRDLVRSQITEVSVIVAYLQSLVALHRLEGSLLERLGIRAPGKTPISS